MHSYRRQEDPVRYVVEFHSFRDWHVVRVCATEAEAAAYVSYLNGGARNAGNHFPPADD